MTGTGSRATRILGIVTLVGLGALVLYGLVLTPPAPDPPEGQGDAMRLIYVHVPTAFSMYIPFTLTFVGSLLWLVRKSVWWDTLAGAAAEVGVLLTTDMVALGRRFIS